MSITRYPTAPAFPGVTFRPALLPDDLAGMNEVANASRIAGGEDWVTSYEQFRAFYENLSNCDPATDILVVERDGRIVGYGRASWYEDLEGQRLYEPTAFAHPHEGVELLAAVTDAMEARCREIAATHPPGAKLFQSDAVDSAIDRLTVLHERGYRPARYYFVMLRPNLEDLADAALPDGLEVRDVEPAHLRAIYDAEVEALRDHWGEGVHTEEDYQQFLADPVVGDHTLWRVAWDGGTIAGIIRGYINEKENLQFGRKRGWVENISVRRPWRRRGLARALIGSTIQGLRARGMTEGALGVDTENLTGALRLYESCGFEVVQRETTLRKPLER